MLNNFSLYIERVGPQLDSLVIDENSDTPAFQNISILHHINCVLRTGYLIFIVLVTGNTSMLKVSIE